MTQYQSGLDALGDLNATNESNEGGLGFSSFKSGSSYKVRATGVTDLISFYSYGIFGKVHSFTAEKPSKKNAKGFAESDLTPWDLASEYHSKLKQKAADAGDTATEELHKTKAALYRVKQRFALGFIDLDTGEPMIVDVSKNQAKVIHAVIKKNEKKLGKVAFELEKNGSGKDTTVMMSVLSLDPEDAELNDKQREVFSKHDGKAFDMALFDGLLYEADDAEQLQLLTQAGFDIALIGAPKADTETAGADIAEEDLPF